MTDKDDEFDFFEIDQDNLDTEWLNQSKIYHDYARKLANARAKHEQAKAELDVVRAELDIQIRDNPNLFGMAKITESAISNVILSQKEFRTASKEVLRTKHRSDLIQATVYALDHRKKALENLVELRLADYFSEPRSKSNGSQEDIKEAKRKRLFKPIPKDEASDDD